MAVEKDPGQDATIRMLAQAEHLANLGCWEWAVAEGRISVSPQWRAIFGADAPQLSLEELLGRFVHRDDRPVLRRALQDVLAGSAGLALEHRIVRRDGEERWVRVCGEARSEADGSVHRVCGVALDVTERRWLARELEEREERLRLTLAATNDGLWDWDVPSGRLRVNERFFGMLGQAPDAFEPNRDAWLAQVHPDDRVAARDALEAAIAADDAVSLQYRLRRASGAWVWVLARGQVVERWPDGAPRRVVGTHTDVDHHRRIVAALRESERSYRDLLNAVDEAIFVLDPVSGRVVDANEVSARLYGVGTRDEVVGLELDALVGDEPPYDKARARALLEEAPGGGAQRFDWLARRRCGEHFWAEVHLSRARIGGRRLVLVVVRDVDEQRRMRQQLRLAASVLENAEEGVMVTDAELRIRLVNRAFTEITGFTAAEALGQTPRIFGSEQQDEEFYRALWRDLRETGCWSGEFCNQRKGGEPYPERLRISTVEDGTGQVSHYVGVFSDISERQRIERDLDHFAHHDPLTHLANRTLLRARLDHGLQLARRAGRPLAVLMVDLQRFKHVNDSLGPDVGDAVLVDAADTLSTLVRASDTVARLGSDEFVVVTEDLQRTQDVAVIAEKIIEAFRRPRVIGEHRIFLAVCIGISVFPRDGEDRDTLLRQAGVALAEAERLGVNRFAFYASRMDQRTVESLAMDNAMKEGLARGEFHVHYQVQVSLDDDVLTGVEALLRWESATLGSVAPERFVPAAEDNGLIGQFGVLVLSAACAQLAEWDRMGFRVPRIAVNISVRELERPGFVDDFLRLAAETGIDAARIELEVTESALALRMDEVLATLARLREAGVGFAIDDFGTGYSSLVYLKRLPIQRLKIDRSFIRDIGRGGNDEAITRAVIGLGQSLGLTVIAEGVETREQAAFLRREGCREAQGYFFGRPMRPAELAARWARADGDRGRRFGGLVPPMQSAAAAASRRGEDPL